MNSDLHPYRHSIFYYPGPAAMPACNISEDVPHFKRGTALSRGQVGIEADNSTAASIQAGPEGEFPGEKCPNRLLFFTLYGILSSKLNLKASFSGRNCMSCQVDITYINSYNVSEAGNQRT